jgi:hypothetical protein
MPIPPLSIFTSYVCVHPAGNMEVWNGDVRFVPEGLELISCEVTRTLKSALFKGGIEYVEALVCLPSFSASACQYSA